MIDGADLALARAGGAKAYLIRPLEPDRRNKVLDTTPLVSIPQRPQDWAMIAACEMTSTDCTALLDFSWVPLPVSSGPTGSVNNVIMPRVLLCLEPCQLQDRPPPAVFVLFSNPPPT
jgi:hypothetical protein